MNPKPITADELFGMSGDGSRYELSSGELRMMSPSGGRHGRIVIEVAYHLKRHVDAGRLGVVYAAETGFLICTNPDTVLAPDVAFVERSRLKLIDDETKFVPLAPDLVVEVLSPSDRFSRVEGKAFTWLDAGTKAVLLVDPDTETIHCYRSRKHIEVFHRNETLDLSEVIPGWALPTEEVFKARS